MIPTFAFLRKDAGAENLQGRPPSRESTNRFPVWPGAAFFTREKKDSLFTLLDAFMAGGGALIDSGRGYGDSETVLGMWMDDRGNRDRVTLITKCAHGEGIIPQEGYSTLVREELTTSLRELMTDHVEIFFVHRDNQEMPVWDILDPLNEEVGDAWASLGPRIGNIAA